MSTAQTSIFDVSNEHGVLLTDSKQAYDMLNTVTPQQIREIEDLGPSFSESIRRPVDPETKQEAMKRVESNANPEWMAAATQTVKTLCETRSEFTTDDVWAVLDTLEVSTKQRRALGPVMTNAAESGWCRMKDCRPVPSKRPACHRRPIPVWQSLIFPYLA